MNGVLQGPVQSFQKTGGSEGSRLGWAQMAGGGAVPSFHACAPRVKYVVRHTVGAG